MQTNFDRITLMILAALGLPLGCAIGPGTLDGTDTESTDPETSGPGDGDGDGDTGDGDGDTGDGDGDTMDSTTGDPPEDCMTPADQTGSSCGAETGFVGAYAVGESDVTAIGAILETDNGLGNGREDWYRFDFPLDAMSPRPATGLVLRNMLTDNPKPARAKK